MSGITTARDAMKKMPEQDRAKILEQVEVFKVEKRKFDIEVSKWDDNGNDIIVLAKHMVRFFFPVGFKISIICSNRHFDYFYVLDHLDLVETSCNIILR